ncbi:galactose-specific lectin nattectin-like [Salvelinus fontinalis]|uniref:galactose-specific lectin nattectin-like n=2 Tax=Salvelinus TaxID=8033 RepID=UPI002486C7F3|nr:galactose-specific lectin nattectin-like [Salvelinus fontinalis]
MFVFFCVISLLSLALDAEHDTPDQVKELSRKSCTMGWYDFNGRCYKYVATRLDWADAESYCVTQGANLASVHSEAEHQFIKILIKMFDPAEFYTWIGLSDIVKEGRWMWTDGSKVDFTDWFKSDPDGGKAQNCVNTNYQTLWIDNECSEGYAFVCAERLC